MSSEPTTAQNQSVRVRAENVGGISETTVEFDPGVTILAGRNATNRTSLLRAIMLALGSERTSLKGDADHGEVELSIGEEMYSRTMTRKGDTVVLEGDPYLEDAEAADLFAFLLEESEARRAVAQGDDLRKVIMRPIDTEEINNEIDRLEAERREIDDRLEEIEEEERRLPGLEERRVELEERIEERRDELGEVESELESIDATVEESREDEQELESKLDDLRETRSELEQVRKRTETEDRSIDSLEDEREDIESQLDKLDETTDSETDLDREVDRLRERKRTIDSMVGELQNIIQFNEEMLEGDRNDMRSALDRSDRAVTDQLVDSMTICWTCGSEVQRDQIETTLDQLRQFRREKLETIREIESELNEVQDKRNEIEHRQRQRERLETRLTEIDDETERRCDRKTELQEQQTELEGQLESLEAEVEALRSEEFEGILERHREANEIEFEIGQLGEELEDVDEEIETIESTLDERNDLEPKREEVTEALVEMRTRIERIEERAVEQFNAHMETVLELLDYENLERIWIERVERSVREGRRKVEQSQFDLHIIRMNEEEVTYEDTVDHLSESEREVTGLVFALAGYLANEVYETLPLIILDSLEAVDSDRIAALIEYFNDYADYVVVALLPEDEQALDQSYQRIRDI